MSKGHSILSYVLLILFTCLGLDRVSAEVVELNGKVVLLSGSGMPATVILHSYADESYMATSNIDKDGNFSFKVDIARAGLYNIRLLRISEDIMLSAAEKNSMVTIVLDKDIMKSIETGKSPENEAYKKLKALILNYDPKLRMAFMYCDKQDSCEKELHKLLTDFAREILSIQQSYKGTYTADVLCRMRMPIVSKNIRNTSDEFRKGFFENVNFADSTIFYTPVYMDMIVTYIDFLVEPSISKEEQFIRYFIDKTKANPVVFHKSASLLFDDLFKRSREKMLAMYIAWYNEGDNKKLVNNPVMDVKIKNISRVMPGQPFTDAVCPDSGGVMRSLKDVVSKSKCTLLLFWSSDCYHCRDEMPFIKQYYEKYHAKGFDVYAVSLENDIEKWKHYIIEKGLSWTNVLNGRNMDPNPAIQYVSVSTPTLILIDGKGTILHRFIPKTKLEDHIVEALK
jgi:thiol-disulfide isomerase/thioredoxin